MNCEVFSLAPLRCEAFQAKETLRAVLHTILFARTLGVVRPRDVDSELFDLTYATCGDPAVERHVEERLDALVRWLAKQDREDDTVARVCLSFYEPKDKRGGGGSAAATSACTGSSGGSPSRSSAAMRRS